jgi:large subunit ribosomal protein L13
VELGAGQLHSALQWAISALSLRPVAAQAAICVPGNLLSRPARLPKQPTGEGKILTTLQKTYVATPSTREREWLLVDAAGQTLGRLATQIADALRGKRKAEYTPHVDTGDFVVVINAEKVQVTGNKRQAKKYRRHSGYTGGLRERSFEEMLDRRPEEVLRIAVKGMMPRNRLARQQLRKLKIYAGSDHPHAAQQPKKVELT